MSFGTVQDRDDQNPGLPDNVWQAVSSPARRAVLERLPYADLLDDPDFGRLTTLAAATFGAPVALLSLVDSERQFFPSRTGVDDRETPVGLSFCAHAIASGNDVMTVTDATADPRFAGNALVTGPHNVRFYAGAPLVVDGERIGTLCVLDRVPRAEPDAQPIEQLKLLAGLASSLFALKEGTRSGAMAQMALDREEKRRAVALEAASLSSWIWDVRTDRVECDTSLLGLFGLPATNPLKARKFFRAIDKRDVRAADLKFRRALETSDDYFGEYRVRHIEPTRWLAARGRVIERGPDGRPLLVFGVNYDITERKTGEERQRLLLRELNHRVKNTLATVQALASQTVRHASNPREFLEAFSSRLQALGVAHGLLSDREWRGIALRDLLRLEITPFDDETSPRVRLDGADAYLSPDQALGLGMVTHELASNAVKYGALSVPKGTVDLSWKIEGRDPSRRLKLAWREVGGPSVSRPDREGFGMILIRRGLDKIMSSEVRHEFGSQGVVAEISLPLESNAA
ncbi:sensor histidine kinase [Mesorhizobium sp. IMUNJ 23232]|uniref:sensor histidine kinase n=1 Tax=Mesorhizobium sp. IMUNJ 23232 TaxID=3376064 RepID=UPI0037B376DA